MEEKEKEGSGSSWNFLLVPATWAQQCSQGHGFAAWSSSWREVVGRGWVPAGWDTEAVGHRGGTHRLPITAPKEMTWSGCYGKNCLLSPLVLRDTVCWFHVCACEHTQGYLGFLGIPWHFACYQKEKSCSSKERAGHKYMLCPRIYRWPCNRWWGMTCWDQVTLSIEGT